MNILVQGTKPFRIVKIQGEAEGVTALNTRKDDTKVQVIQIKFQPTQVGELRRQLILTTDGGINIPVNIEGSAITP